MRVISFTQRQNLENGESSPLRDSVQSEVQENSLLRVFFASSVQQKSKELLKLLALYQELLCEFERLKAAGVKVSPALLRLLPLNTIHNSDGVYNQTTLKAAH